MVLSTYVNVNFHLFLFFSIIIIIYDVNNLLESCSEYYASNLMFNEEIIYCIVYCYPQDDLLVHFYGNSVID